VPGRLAVRIAGQGERNLVLVHGWGFHSGAWDPVVDELGAEFVCHLVELPGHGGSPMIEPYDTERLADALEGALPERIDGLVGWSMGGAACLALALRRPDLDFPLGLVATTAKFSADGGVARAGAGLAGTVLSSLWTDIRSMLPSAERAPEPRVGFARRARMFFSRPPSTPSGLLKGLRWLREQDRLAELGDMRRRTLVIHGIDDRVIPPEAGLALSRGIPGARLELIEGASHAVFWDRPRQCAQALRSFLDDGRPAP